MIHSANVLLQVDYVPGIMLSTRDKNEQKSSLYSTNIDGLPALCGLCLQDKSSLWEHRRLSR